MSCVKKHYGIEYGITGRGSTDISSFTQAKREMNSFEEIYREGGREWQEQRETEKKDGAEKRRGNGEILTQSFHSASCLSVGCIADTTSWHFKPLKRTTCLSGRKINE